MEGGQRCAETLGFRGEAPASPGQCWGTRNVRSSCTSSQNARFTPMRKTSERAARSLWERSRITSPCSLRMLPPRTERKELPESHTMILRAPLPAPFRTRSQRENDGQLREPLNGNTDRSIRPIPRGAGLSRQDVDLSGSETLRCTTWTSPGGETRCPPSRSRTASTRPAPGRGSRCSRTRSPSMTARSSGSATPGAGTSSRRRSGTSRRRRRREGLASDPSVASGRHAVVLVSGPSLHGSARRLRTCRVRFRRDLAVNGGIKKW